MKPLISLFSQLMSPGVITPVKHAQWCVWPLAADLSLPSSDVRSEQSPSEDSGPDRLSVWSHLGPFCSVCKQHTWWILSRGGGQCSEIISLCVSLAFWGGGGAFQTFLVNSVWLQTPTSLQKCRKLEKPLRFGVIPRSLRGEGGGAF